MIEEAYVSFETAKLLKEKGFPQEYDIFHSMVYNEEDYEDEYEVQRMVLETKLVKAGTLSSYPVGVLDPKCYCPTQQMAMRWLREIHNIVIAIDVCRETGREGFYCWQLEDSHTGDNIVNIVGECPTYEQAVEAAILYSLKNLI